MTEVRGQRSEDRKIVAFPAKTEESSKCRERNIHGVSDAEYKTMVLTAFDQLEHEDRREFMNRKADVERAARQRL